MSCLCDINILCVCLIYRVIYDSGKLMGGPGGEGEQSESVCDAARVPAVSHSFGILVDTLIDC